MIIEEIVLKEDLEPIEETTNNFFMKKFNDFISVFLVLWIGVFTQISITHSGHGHELITPEASLCSDNCEIESHRNTGIECDLFIAKRLLQHDGAIGTPNLTLLELETAQKWTVTNSLYRQFFNNNNLIRGPPILL